MPVETIIGRPLRAMYSSRSRSVSTADGVLMAGRIERVEQIGAAAVPGAAHELQAQTGRQIAQAVPVGVGELELEAVLAVRGTQRVRTDGTAFPAPRE